MPGIFQVTIPNLPALQEALSNAAEIVKPTLQNAIQKAQAILAQNTVAGNVPWKTGHLATTFQPEFGDLWAIWKPTASYAAYVEFGTGIYRVLKCLSKPYPWYRVAIFFFSVRFKIVSANFYYRYFWRINHIITVNNNNI